MKIVQPGWDKVPSLFPPRLPTSKRPKGPAPGFPKNPRNVQSQQNFRALQVFFPKSSKEQFNPRKTSRALWCRPQQRPQTMQSASHMLFHLRWWVAAPEKSENLSVKWSREKLKWSLNLIFSVLLSRRETLMLKPHLLQVQFLCYPFEKYSAIIPAP